MRYLSVCSGIDAATVAWKPLGWECAGLSEIEAFPRAVCEQRHGAVAADWDHRASVGTNMLPLFGDFTRIEECHVGPVDLLVGGTPCQSFSIAGLRGGLADDRGNLALEYLRLADRLRPRWLLWENVPGVLSIDGGRAFGAILGGMAELGYGFAYRVLDAQYFGVPQRRRRVFVVGCAGDWRRAAAVLSERESLSGYPPPRRGARTAVAALTANCVETCGADDNQGEPGHLISAGFNAGNREGPADVAAALVATGGNRLDWEVETFVAHSLRTQGFDASEDGTGRGTPITPVHAFDARQTDVIQYGDQAGPLDTDTYSQAICFSAKDYGGDALEDCSPTIRPGNHAGSHANAGAMPAVAYDLRGRESGAQIEGPHETANLRSAGGCSSRSYVAAAAVRRLTPPECERLQGFPDGFTAIEVRGKPAADGPRYKALGNSMAVPVMAWIARRIAAVDAILLENLEAA